MYQLGFDLLGSTPRADQPLTDIGAIKEWHVF
jgi:hypothetical protein